VIVTGELVIRRALLISGAVLALALPASALAVYHERPAPRAAVMLSHFARRDCPRRARTEIIYSSGSGHYGVVGCWTRDRYGWTGTGGPLLWWGTHWRRVDLQECLPEPTLVAIQDLRPYARLPEEACE